VIPLSVELVRLHPIGLVAGDGSLWVTVVIPWWDLAGRFWWWLAPTDKRATIKLRLSDGGYYRTRAMRVAQAHVNIQAIEKIK
jgi:hypothetical protein